MKVLHRDGRSPRVVKRVQRVYTEHEHHRAVEDDHQDDDGHDPHQRHCPQVALAVVGGTKDWLRVRVTDDLELFGERLYLGKKQKKNYYKSIL